jgi:hypothetical protein
VHVKAKLHGAANTAANVWRLAAFFGIVSAVVIAAAVYLAGSPDFRIGFFTNFLATVAGVALGVPVAVWLTLQEAARQERLNKSQAEAEASAARSKEETKAADRRRDVLVAIRTELTENLVGLEDRRPHGERIFVIPFLMDEVWSAISDGGELKWVNDPEILRQLARSYVFIRLHVYLERQLFELRHYPGPMIASNDAEVRLIGYFNDRIDEVCRAAIDEALAAIRAVVPDENPAQTEA